jgi:hypothetical protein
MTYLRALFQDSPGQTVKLRDTRVKAGRTFTEAPTRYLPDTRTLPLHIPAWSLMTVTGNLKHCTRKLFRDLYKNIPQLIRGSTYVVIGVIFEKPSGSWKTYMIFLFSPLPYVNVQFYIGVQITLQTCKT